MTPNQLPPLPDGVTLEDLLIPLRAALETCHDTDWSLRQFKTPISHALAALAQQAQEPVSKLHHMLVMGHEPWEIPAETIERDAIRYRWLRQQFWDDGVMCVVMNPKSNVTLGATCPSLKMLDKAIDTSMCATPPAPQVPAPVDELPDLNPEDVAVDVVLKQLGGFAPVTTHGVRVTHKPSRVSVVVDSERSQHRNRQLALEALRATIHHQANPVPAPVDELIEALEDLMDWQVKNVKSWHNRAYDRAHFVIEKHRAALQSPAPQTKGGEA